MSPSIRRRLRLARRGLWYVTAVSLVLVAVAVGIVSQLLPLAERHPDRIAEWLSARAGRPVHFERVETEWTRRGPLLRLDGLRVGEGSQAVAIGEAEILVSQYAGLLPGRSFTELRVRDLALTLERSDDGRWQVRGLPGQAQGGDPLSSLEGLGELQVIHAQLGISAPSLGVDTTIPEVDLRLQVSGDRVRSGLRARIRADASPVDVVLDFDRASGDGRLYAAVKNADLSAWSSLLRISGVTIAEGRGRAQVWAAIRKHQVASISVDGNLETVRLQGAPFAAASTLGRATGQSAGTMPSVRFARLQAVVHWRSEHNGWRLDAPSMQVHADADSQPQVLDGLVLAGGDRYGLRAERIDAGPLFSVVALSDRLDPDLRRWLASATPGAVLERVNVGGLRGGALRAEATVRALQFAPVGDSPGISGLSGDLRGDNDGFVFAFDPATKMRFDWPRGFGVTHVVSMRGQAMGWREAEGGWRVDTPALRIDGQGYGADLRGGLWFQGDGTAPRIDIAADLDDTAAPTAKRFWPKHVMSPELIQWLDTALVAGRVRNGRAIIAGDLDDWPFEQVAGVPSKGVFDARATLEDMRLKFQDEWPATSDMDAEVAFIGNGFSVEGKAVLADVGIHDFRAGIADYGEGNLIIDAHSDADAARLLGLMRQSPLNKEHGPILATLGASGPAAVDFALALPLNGGDSRINGTIELRGVRLAESEWQLAFNNVTGRATYNGNGFSANGLRAQYDRQDGRLSLRAGPGHVRDKRQGFEAELEASMTTDDLLNRSADLAWLKPHVRGRSRWTASIAMPADNTVRRAAGTASATTVAAPAAAQITRLQLRSDLQGTAFDLPAPMDKTSAATLPTTIDLQLPLGKGEVAIAFGQRLALRARQTQGQTGIRAVFGTDNVADAPPPSGLILGGRAATLDAIGWVALTSGDGDNRLALRRADVTADRLSLLGGVFADTRLQVSPGNGGLAVLLDGPALAGALTVPDRDGALLSGRLQRLHWRSAGPPVPAASRAGSSESADSAAADDDFNPADIPAIQLRVDDLRVADAMLGDIQFKSRPTAAGMEIVQLQTSSPKRQIDITGAWNGRGDAARTRLSAKVTSEDFGAFLTDLGIGGRLDGGKGDARFDATWAGSPMAFALATLDGSLQMNVKDGRLVEVEPGGTGRVLGLLSVAQLPRRLTLDFRDFFSKGFAFNKLAGTVRFGNGSARSDDLLIDGPAASIKIRGAANLRAQTFDQTIEVLPKAGNLLTAVGAIAGGPVGAAVGAVANAVLQKPLGQAAAKNYRVTGPWKDPQVDVVERPSPSPRDAG